MGSTTGAMARSGHPVAPRSSSRRARESTILHRVSLAGGEPQPVFGLGAGYPSIRGNLMVYRRSPTFRWPSGGSGAARHRRHIGPQTALHQQYRPATPPTRSLPSSTDKVCLRPDGTNPSTDDSTTERPLRPTPTSSYDNLYVVDPMDPRLPGFRGLLGTFQPVSTLLESRPQLEDTSAARSTPAIYERRPLTRTRLPH